MLGQAPCVGSSPTPPTNMKILVACEVSGRVRDALLAVGHDATSCDFLSSESLKGPHIIGDVSQYLHCGWDLLIAFPPCTYLSASGMHWTTRGLRDPKLTDQAVEFVKLLMDAPVDKIAIENPVGCISTRIRQPDQIIQPYQFGEDASKKTCLWLKNLPLLKPTKYVEPKIVNGKKVWGNQMPSGQNKLGESKARAKLRSITYQGIADAMATQWGEDEQATA